MVEAAGGRRHRNADAPVLFHSERAGHCSVLREGGVLRLGGEIDQANVDEVGTRLIDGVRTGVVALDLSEVVFFTAAGVRAVLAARDALPHDATHLRLRCSPVVLRILRTCGLGPGQGLLITPSEPGSGADR